MTHRHRQRRGVTPRPSEKDLRLWGRLLTRAEVVGRDGRSGLDGFVQAAARAAKAIMPVGHQGKDSPFNQLVLIGLAQEALSAAETAEVRRLTARCREVLAADKPSPRPKDKPAPRMRRTGDLPFRRDIDG